MGMNNVNVKMVWQLQSNNTLNQGYCFVEFPTYQDASQALLNNNGMMIPGYSNRHFKLNWSDKGKDNKTKNNNLENVSSIFVGDLASNVTESQLYDLFVHRYKSTLRAKIMIDLNTGLSKGYGFINFTNPIDQQNALLEMQGVILNGRAIKLGPSNNNNNNNNKSNSTGGQHVPSGNHSTAKPFNNVILPKSQFTPGIQYAPTMNHFTDPNNTTVFIGGLSAHVTEEELRTIFEPFGDIIYINIPLGKGCGFIQFVDRNAGELAITNMQGFPIGSSRIRLSWGRSAKQYSPGTINSSSAKNDVGQLRLTSPIYSNRSYIATSSVANSGRSTEYLPGFQDNYFKTATPSSTSFERLEMRSNMYM